MKPEEPQFGVYDRETGALAYPLTLDNPEDAAALIREDGDLPPDRFYVRAFREDDHVPPDLHERFPEDVRAFLAGQRLRAEG